MSVVAGAQLWKIVSFQKGLFRRFREFGRLEPINEPKSGDVVILKFQHCGGAIVGQK